VKRPKHAARRATVVVAALALLGGVAQRPATAAPLSFTLYGRGWGHGVGMSQWGAKGLAETKHSTTWILTWFYRGTTLQQLPAPAQIRVGLIQEQNRIDITGNGQFDLFDKNGVHKASGTSGQTWSIRPASSQLAVFDGSGALSFVSPAPVTVRWESHGTLMKVLQTGYQYKHDRLDIDLNPQTQKARAILTLPFEQYLYGIGEMPASWPIVALQAQAIAARTYALDKVTRLGQSRPVCNCGVYATTADQAYVGAGQEVPGWVKAVDNTRGKVVTYHGKAIQAYYSASDGGLTENNENVFGGTAIPYLRGVCDPGDYDGGANPNSNWSFTRNGDQLNQAFQRGGYNVGSVQHVDFPGPRGVSGRVLKVIDATHGGVTVIGPNGTARIPGNQFQALLGLKSTLVLHNVSGGIRLKFDALMCVPGQATNDQYTWHELSGKSSGIAQNFTNGRLFGTSSSTIYWVHGPILAKYDDLRRHGYDLGLPTSDEFAISGGRRSNFQRGYIVLNTSTGQTTWHTP
jgi:SpoIID/LytB domain protein